MTVAPTLSKGALQGWIDFNLDGDWNDANEQVFKNIVLDNGVYTLTFNVPSTARPGPSYARFRYGYESDLTPGGFSYAGEVEDYAVTLLSDQPKAVDDFYIGPNAIVQNTSNNVLNVLANDIASSAGALAISSVDNISAGGTVVIDELTLAVAGVGGDLMGDWALQRLAQFGVDTSGVQRRPGCKTSSSIVTTRADGARPALHLKGATSALIATGLGAQAGVRDCAHTLDVMTTTRTRATTWKPRFPSRRSPALRIPRPNPRRRGV